jgi:putative membrane protein
LLILGKYAEITGHLRDVLHGNITVSAVVTIVVFCTGCLIGLLSFSKFLRWLLARHESQTMALLCGFMAGSLRKIWPFKSDLTPDVTDLKLKQVENVWPADLDGSTLLSIGICLVATAFVFVLDWLTKAHAHVPPLEEVSEGATETDD